MKLPVPESEIEISAVRAQGAGGQNVNKVSSAVHLRFDVRASSLSSEHKQRLLALKDRRITREGVIVIKAQAQRTQERNKAEALARLRELLARAMVARRARRATRPTSASRTRRLETKKKRARLKRMRASVDPRRGE